MKQFRQGNDYADVKWGDRSWREFASCAEEGHIVLLPLGSIEQHGPMLPVETDWFLAESWAMEGARRAHDEYGVKVLVLPPLPYGVSTEHMDFAGTISLELDTYVKLLQDIIREVIRAGFKKIVCVSGHGGNIMPAQVSMRDLKIKLKKEKVEGVKLYMADHSECFADSEEVTEAVEQQFHFHASACETAYYLFQHPELVKKEGLVKPEMKRQNKPRAGWWTKDITESGASGNPEKATAEYGEKLYEYFSGAIAQYLKKVQDDE